MHESFMYVSGRRRGGGRVWLIVSLHHTLALCCVGFLVYFFFIGGQGIQIRKFLLEIRVYWIWERRRLIGGM
jgi:hypothetical protein